MGQRMGVAWESESQAACGSQHWALSPGQAAKEEAAATVCALACSWGYGGQTCNTLDSKMTTCDYHTPPHIPCIMDVLETMPDSAHRG